MAKKEEEKEVESALVPSLKVYKNRLILSDEEYAFIFERVQKGFSFLKVRNEFNEKFKTAHSKRGLEEAYKRQSDKLIDECKAEAVVNILEKVSYDYDKCGMYIPELMFLLTQNAKKAYVANDNKNLLNSAYAVAELRKVQVLEKTRVQEITQVDSIVINEKTLDLYKSKILHHKETGVPLSNIIDVKPEFQPPVLPAHLKEE
jgi:hypothetical protein